jgi:CRP/FNR family transcriptional regulator, cyclic AMP receptor protein
MTTMTMEGVDALLRRQPLVNELTAAQFERLSQLAEVVDFAPGEIIHREGDECSQLFLVVRGHVAIEMAGSHEVLRVETVVPGGEFGWTAMLLGAGRYFQARALDAVQVLALDAAGLRTMCDEDSDFGYALMRRLLGVVAGRLQSTRLQVVDMLSTPAKRAGA